MPRAVDLLMVVDDWKSDDRRERGFAARTFSLDDSKVAPLRDLLERGGADGWHASGRRDRHRFLFDSPDFDHIIAALDTAQSRLFEIYFPRDYADGLGNAMEQSFRSAPPKARAMFDRPGSEGVESRALLFFLIRVSFHIRALYPDAPKVRVIVDRMPWLASELDGPFVTLATLLRTLHIDAIADKSHPEVKPILPYLGLVDSELWFFGRYFNYLKFPDGTTIASRLAASKGSPIDQPLFTEDEFKSLIGPHEKHENLLKYLRVWAEWLRRGLAFNVAQSPEEAIEAGRLITEDLSRLGVETPESM